MANANLWNGLRANEVADAPISPSSYHNNMWQSQAAMYRELWEYWNRDVFDETIDNASDDKKYPLGINLFETACVNHRACLFGEFGEDVLQFRVKSKNVDAVDVEEKLDRIWVESGRNSLLLEAGLVANILGGTVFRVVYNPVHKKVYVKHLVPDAFFPVWDLDDYHTINECFISFITDAATASWRYHVKLPEDKTLVQVYEHWNKKRYEVTVDGKPAYWDEGHKWRMAGDNPYIDPRSGEGILPFEYFPLDRAGQFYGTPLAKNVMDLQNELNIRAADMGDAVMEATHLYKFVRNRPRGAKGLEVLSRTKLNDLGVVPPAAREPDVFSISGGEVSPATTDWIKALEGEIRTAMYTPPVSYGQDEGSQRSALTLAFRMWPLTQKVRTTRGFWSDSFYHLNRKIMIVAATKGGYDLAPRHSDFRTIPTWAPMLPRDRAEEVNEVVVRKQAGLISIYHGVELLEDRETDFIEEEVARIETDQEREAELMAQTMGAQPGMGGQGLNQSAPKKMPTE